jgi:hypothetical protein
MCSSFGPTGRVENPSYFNAFFRGEYMNETMGMVKFPCVDDAHSTLMNARVVGFIGLFRSSTQRDNTDVHSRILR